MATTTMNGWSLTSVPLATITAGGRSTQVRAGAVATILGHVARRFHAEVEPLVTFHGWRSVATNASVGGHPRSNHPSGTAFDANGYAHPYKAPVNFTAAQVAAIRRILAEVAPVVRWGGDFGAALRDGMHFEIVGSEAQVVAIAARLTPAPTAPAPEDDMPITEAEYQRLKGDMQATADSAVRGLIPTIVEAVWARPVTRVLDHPTTALQDMVDGTTAALTVREIVQHLPAAIIAALPPGGTSGPSLEQVEAAVKWGLGTLTLKSV